MDKTQPPLKKTKLFDTNKCIICLGTLTKCKAKDSVVKNPTSQGLNAIFDVSEKRKDEVYVLLKPMKEEILFRKYNCLIPQAMSIFLHKQIQQL